MWGRATFTMLVSSTTMSWAVRITRRNTDGAPRARRTAPAPGGRVVVTSAGRARARVGEGIDFDLSAAILDSSGSFLRLVYGGYLRLATHFAIRGKDAGGEPSRCGPSPRGPGARAGRPRPSDAGRRPPQLRPADRRRPGDVRPGGGRGRHGGDRPRGGRRRGHPLPPLPEADRSRGGRLPGGRGRARPHRRRGRGGA